MLGHATFCIVVVYNNAVARFRRTSGSLIEASMDLGADGFQTFRHVILPNIGTALLAGGMLAFALCFDEVIVTTFTAGQQQTLPIWMLEELVRPRQRPVTNVVAMVVVLVTFLPILAAYYLTRDGDQCRRAWASELRGDCMDTEMLIGSRFEARHRDRGDRSSTRAPASFIEAMPEASPAQIDAAVAAAEKALRDLVAHDAGAALGLSAEDRRRASRPRPASFAALEALNCGKPINAVLNDEIPAIVDCYRFFAGAVRTCTGAVGGRIPARPHLDDPPRPDRRRRLDRAVELSADDDGLEARAGASPAATRWCSSRPSRRR